LLLHKRGKKNKIKKGWGGGREKKKKLVKNKEKKICCKKEEENLFSKLFFFWSCGFYFIFVKERVFFWCVFGKLEVSNVLILMEYVWKVGR